MNEERQSYLIRVRGRVQGVGFRYAVQQQARALGLKGWVRNLSDGSVEATIQGSPSACNSFLSWCRSNPGYSWVEEMDITEGPDEIQDAFRIRYS